MELASTTLDVAWRQWSAIGAMGTTSHGLHSLVDPEALVLYSLLSVETEYRLEPMLFSWLELNAALLSVQRIRNLQSRFPLQIRPLVQRFSRTARMLAKHPRWQALGDANEEVDVAAESETVSRHVTSDVKRAIRVPLSDPCALLLRFRQAFGVGVKADILAVLLTNEDKPLPVKELAELAGYTQVAVRAALTDLAHAGFVITRQGRPLRYIAPVQPWRGLLSMKSIPAWQPWAAFYGFSTAVQQTVGEGTEKGWSEYALFTKVRARIRQASSLFEHVTTTQREIDLLDEDVGGAIQMLTRWAAKYA